jgi:hypothetical protein
VSASHLGKSDTSRAQSLKEEQRLDIVRKANKIYLQQSEAIETLKLDVSAMNKGYSYIKRKNENLYNSQTSNSRVGPGSILTSQNFGSLRGSGLSISSLNVTNSKPALTNSDFVATTKEQIVTKKKILTEHVDSNGNKQIIKRDILTKETKRHYQQKCSKMISPGQKQRLTKMDTIDEDSHKVNRGTGVMTTSFFENQSVIF